jgi:hypothetical protein
MQIDPKSFGFEFLQKFQDSKLGVSALFNNFSIDFGYPVIVYAMNHSCVINSVGQVIEMI